MQWLSVWNRFKQDFLLVGLRKFIEVTLWIASKMFSCLFLYNQKTSCSSKNALGNSKLLCVNSIKQSCFLTILGNTPIEDIVGKWENADKQLFLSSPEHKVLRVSYCDRPMSSVCCPSSFNNFSKHLLLNHWANLDETWQGYSVGEALQNCSKNLIPSITLVAMATKRRKKIFENLIFWN